MLTTVWLSFDLGVSGDYDGMYRWLAAHNAVECGDSLALVRIDTLKFPKFPDGLIENISTDVEINPRKTRIYIVWKDQGKFKGRFIFGNRRQAPWAGYGILNDQEDDI